MKEIKLGDYAGPFCDITYDNYMQSPIGLVPKDNGRQSRPIFHLSYDFPSGEKSLNFCTPTEMCSVSYRDLDHTVRNCLKLLSRIGGKCDIYYSKTDVRSAFRVVPLLPSQYKWLVMKAKDPVTGETYFFIDKCLPFGASISCAIFQAFSDALAHIMLVKYGHEHPNSMTNYLDDFLFLAYTEMLCDRLVKKFLDLCLELGCPIAEEKTVWGLTRIVFLGIFLDGVVHVLAIPEDKCIKAVNMLREILARKTVTVKDLQKLTGTLNFSCRAIFPGRAVLRRMYDRMTTGSGIELKGYHHIRVNADLKDDCKMWLKFLNTKPVETVLC